MTVTVAMVVLFFAILLFLWSAYGYWRAQEGVEGAAGADGPAPAGRAGGTTSDGAAAGAVLTAADGTVGALVGVIPAWRCWRVDGSYAGTTLLVRLVSQTRLEYWEGPVQEADAEPTPTNGNGLYAAKDWESPILPCHTNEGKLRVLGRVGLYGTVVEGDRGYRAQRAVIEELWIVDAAVYIRLFQAQEAALPLDTLEAALADRYQVEVHRGWPDGRVSGRRRTVWWE